MKRRRGDGGGEKTLHLYSLDVMADSAAEAAEARGSHRAHQSGRQRFRRGPPPGAAAHRGTQASANLGSICTVQSYLVIECLFPASCLSCTAAARLYHTSMTMVASLRYCCACLPWYGCSPCAKCTF